jgi:hypothetical protein
MLFYQHSRLFIPLETNRTATVSSDSIVVSAVGSMVRVAVAELAAKVTFVPMVA